MDLFFNKMVAVSKNIIKKFYKASTKKVLTFFNIYIELLKRVCEIGGILGIKYKFV